jgi:cytochrome c peroxidase
LGKRLFFDPILSLDSSISCASCHAPEHAFADHNLALSKGIYGRVGTRNSPALFNLAWQNSFNWDGGVNHLEVFSVAPITNEVEMGEDLKNIMRKLNQNQSYKQQFKEAFDTDKIEDKEFLLAITQYMLMIVSDDAKYDQVQKGTATFTELEKEGYLVYQKNCSSCHVEPLFTSPQFKSNGFNTDSKEQGRMRITQLEEDRNLFKVPSLRNLKFTYPYMHNGKLWHLDAVIDHYIQPKPNAINAEPAIVNGMPLTNADAFALKAFLNTLNDNTFIANPLYR